jgi:hypothetical protein
VINVIVRELAPLERFLSSDFEESAGARVHQLPGTAPASAPGEELEGGEVAASMRAAVPPMQSFGMGRRR